MAEASLQMITFSIDGLEVQAPENLMLADAAKLGDIEIPVFCYEPKLGPPVGACRMCMVEIEGVPKLQTACSTQVKDGMVVFTQTDRVREAQQSVVEFLLVNHPLDCPVCDKGGECPLQDITFGWGGGSSRFIEPKRHFRKPLELSPLIAIDRERCILCYRCVRFSQEVSDDHQLVLLERGADTFVGTFDGHPYVAPFSGNIIELCPVGALTSRAYRFRARPWEVEGAGSLCTLCPAQCNVSLTVRDDERVLRVLARDNTDVDDGWLCDLGRFAYQAIHADERITEPMVRDGGILRPVSWERALEEATSALRRSGAATAALAGGGTTNEEGYLLARLMREELGSGHLESSAAAAVPLAVHRALANPELQAAVADLEHADAVLVLDCEPLDDAPVLDLRIRKGVRLHGHTLAVASSRPSALDAVAAASTRFAPGGGAAFAQSLAAALRGDGEGPAAEIAAALGGCEAVVVLYSERLLGEGGGAALLELADALAVGGHSRAGLLGIPEGANGRGLREVGVLANAGPGLAELPAGGLNAPGIAAALAAGELKALYLLGCDPLRTHDDRAAWLAALTQAKTVIAHAAYLTEGIRDHATVVFPAEASAEKDGTMTHPDGRLQRLRAAIGPPGSVRAEWQLLAELARSLGAAARPRSAAAASAEVFEAVPFYRGLTLEELGGRGVRWPERPGAAALVSAGAVESAAALEPPRLANGQLRLGSFRSIWAGVEVEVAPALRFLVPRQSVELSPADAQRLGLKHGDEVAVGEDDRCVQAQVCVRDAMPEGSVFLQRGIAEDGANALTGPFVELRGGGAA